jgi:hypothetical protein
MDKRENGKCWGLTQLKGELNKFRKNRGSPEELAVYLIRHSWPMFALCSKLSFLFIF